jgi:adenosylcobyric acid synthase
LEWHARARHVWPLIRASLDELMAEHDVLVIEGAGSPAEINLQHSDVVNMRIAEAAGAATLLICDIDRGGAFAHLYGTMQLLPPAQRALIRGFVLNKFRGDERLLAPAPQRLEELTGVPTLAVLPYWRDHGLPEEDGVFDTRPTGGGRAVVVAAYPYISNLDEFAPLRRVPGLTLSWARQPESIAAADILVLPGSKHVAADLAWLRERRLDAAIAAHIAADRPTLAICGGLQMLGRGIEDPHGVEGSAQGLGLLPCSTEFSKAKCYRHGAYTFDDLSGFWEPLEGIGFTGYEIHHGATRLDAHAQSQRAPRAVLADGAGWQSGQLLALYPHGLFESAAVIRALFGAEVPTLEDTFDGLADFIDTRFAPGVLASLLD